MKSLFVFLFLFYSSLGAEDLIEYDYELDAYYSNVSAFIDLDRDHEIADASSESEAQLYTKLIKKTFSPNIFLLEAALHPMPLLGLYIKDTHGYDYERARYRELNLIKAVTAGFEEPYSFSLFLGRMLVFKNNDSQRIGKNRAYIGYLFSVGDYSIKENVAHKNRWLNFEFKLKGTREKRNQDLDWSFRVGGKVNENANFVNTFYFGARRSSIDYKKSTMSIIYNSAFSSMIEFSAENFSLTLAEIMIEKKFPLQWSEKMVFGLGLGYLYNSGEKYKNELRDEGIETHQILFRPNLKF